MLRRHPNITISDAVKMSHERSDFVPTMGGYSYDKTLVSMGSAGSEILDVYPEEVIIEYWAGREENAIRRIGNIVIKIEQI